MYHTANKLQGSLLDFWSELCPKQKALLSKTWAQTFRDHVLPRLPAQELAKAYSRTKGRPSKECHMSLGVLVLQQLLNLSDAETCAALSFDVRWHYAMDLHEEGERYMCKKTLWSTRQTVIESGIYELLFDKVTMALAKDFKVNVSNQRIDSVHIRSNMRRLSRIGLFSLGIRSFLRKLSEYDISLLKRFDAKLVERYTGGFEGYFGQIKPQDSCMKLQEVADTLHRLVRHFTHNKSIRAMGSFQIMERILSEQCVIKETDKDSKVELKEAKDVAPDCLQNPSDPDATFSHRKGQGYSGQIMETFTPDKGDDSTLNLIVHAEATPACEGDNSALQPAIDKAIERNLKPQRVLGDTHYGDDENVQQAKTKDVEVIAPVAGRKKETKIYGFVANGQDEIVCCPAGFAPMEVRHGNKHTKAVFERRHCDGCTHRNNCAVMPCKQGYVFYYSAKMLRLNARKVHERSQAFREQYGWRAGVEGSISMADRRTGLKQLKVRGRRNVRYCVLLKALGVNILRANAYKNRGEVCPGEAKTGQITDKHEKLVPLSTNYCHYLVAKLQFWLFGVPTGQFSSITA